MPIFNLMDVSFRRRSRARSLRPQLGKTIVYKPKKIVCKLQKNVYKLQLVELVSAVRPCGRRVVVFREGGARGGS